MTRLFTLLFLLSNLFNHAQKNAMNDTISLILNKKTTIDNSLSIVLTRFSHKNAISDKEASISSSHLIFFQGKKEYKLVISMYESADRISYEKEYESINWKEYTIKLKSLNYDQSIDVIITKTENYVKKIILKDKNTLIAKSNEIIASKYPEFVFDSLLYEITVWKNSKKTIVKYRRIIRFTPLNKKNENLQYDFEVNLTNQNISPFDYYGLEKFYFPTTEEQEKIDFVVTNFGLPLSGFDNSIIEDSDRYYINIDNDTSFGRYCIDKITGEEFMNEVIQGSYEPMPLPELINTDPLIEIKE